MIDTELNDALDAYSQRLKVLSEQATIRSMVRGASHQPSDDDQTCNDLDFVIESLATPATSRTFSAFDVSNAILDGIDEGYVVNGHRFGWLFDCGTEDFANSQRLDFRDLVLARLQKGGSNVSR